MAAATDATNPFEEKACEACGSVIRRGTMSRLAFAMKRLCRDGCGLGAVPSDDPARLSIRFWNKVDKRPGSGPQGDCWVWVGRKDAHGYGVAKLHNSAVKAHRLALFGIAGIDSPLFACHRCDNPQCVRPDHLFPGEAIDNVHDMIAKGRSYSGPWRGRSSDRHPGRKLTDDQVREIRETGISKRKGAEKYGVSTFTIAGVKNGSLYKDVA